MSNWGNGYVTDITYTTGWYRHQAPSVMRFDRPRKTNRDNYFIFGSVVFPCFMASDSPIRTPLTSVA